jgi:hypothetical protein
MITYSWFIDKFTVLTNYNSLPNVVQTIHWRFVGMDDNGIYASISASTDIPLPIGNYIQFENLTQEFVESWLIDALGQNNVDSFKLAIEQQINEKINPTKLDLSPPWIVVE